MGGSFLSRHDPTVWVKPLDATDLATALDAIGRGYNAALRMTAALAPSDRRRCLSKAPGRYLRLLTETIRTAERLVGAEVSP